MLCTTVFAQGVFSEYVPQKNEIIFNYEGKAVYMNLNYEEDNNFFGYKFVKYPPVFKEYDVVVKEDVYTNLYEYKKIILWKNFLHGIMN